MHYFFNLFLIEEILLEEKKKVHVEGEQGVHQPYITSDVAIRILVSF